MSLTESQDKEGVDRPTIVWDGTGLSRDYSGIGVYGRLLYEALGELGCSPCVVAFDGAIPAYVPAEQQIKIAHSSNLIFAKLEQLKPFHALSTYGASKERWPDKGLIFHGLSNVNLPAFLKKRSRDRFVITIHDLIPFNLEEISPLALQMRALLPRVIERADKIITPSYWTKIQILEQFGAHLSDKIENVGNGTVSSPIVGKVWNEREIDALTIARGEKYKRLELISAIAGKLSSKKFTVVTDERGEKILRDRPSNVNLLKDVAAAELEELYANSKALLHPSLYEGWCFPASDALARGLMLLYCRGSGIDEVAACGKKLSKGLKQEASIDDWVSALEALVAKGPQQPEAPRLPSWLEIAQKTLKIYDSLL